VFLIRGRSFLQVERVLLRRADRFRLVRESVRNVYSMKRSYRGPGRSCTPFSLFSLVLPLPERARFFCIPRASGGRLLYFSSVVRVTERFKCDFFPKTAIPFPFFSALRPIPRFFPTVLRTVPASARLFAHERGDPGKKSFVRTVQDVPPLEGDPTLGMLLRPILSFLFYLFSGVIKAYKGVVLLKPGTAFLSQIGFPSSLFLGLSVFFSFPINPAGKVPVGKE